MRDPHEVDKTLYKLKSLWCLDQMTEQERTLVLCSACVMLKEYKYLLEDLKDLKYQAKEME